MFLTEEACQSILSSASRAHPHETGGILIGVRASDSPWAVLAIEVSSENSGPHHYVLPEGSTQVLVNQMRELDRRLGYIGDWHSHPQNAGPSDVDLNTVREVCATPEVPNPVLLIARRHVAGYDLDALELRSEELGSLSVVLTGSLARE